MAFKLGKRKKQPKSQANNPNSSTSPFSNVSDFTVGLVETLEVFNDQAQLDSSIDKRSMASSSWKKIDIPYLTADSDNWNPYELTVPRTAGHFKDKDPSNFTISDNLNQFYSYHKKGQINADGETTQTDVMGSSSFEDPMNAGADLFSANYDDRRGSQWGVPLFHHPWYHTSAALNDKYSRTPIKFASKLRSSFFVSNNSVDSNNEKLVQGLNEFRPSSLLEPEAWHGRALNVASTVPHYRFDWFRHKNIQYIQLVTNTNNTDQLQNQTGFKVTPHRPSNYPWDGHKDSSNLNLDIERRNFNTTADGVDGYLPYNIETSMDSAPIPLGYNDPAFRKKYGKTIGYVLEPGRHIIEAKSDFKYNDWRHTDQLGHGKWAGMSVPSLTTLDSDRGQGQKRSSARRNKKNYLTITDQNTTAVYQPTYSYVYNNQPVQDYATMAYGPNEPNRANPYVSMTIGQPMVLFYFGKDSNSYDNYRDRPYLSAIHPQYDVDDFDSIGWEGAATYDNRHKLIAGKLFGSWSYGGRYGGLYEQHIQQDIIDSSAINWSGGKGAAALQERAHKYPYAVADYCPSRTSYNRKGENVLYDTQINHTDPYDGNLSFFGKKDVKGTNFGYLYDNYSSTGLWKPLNTKDAYWNQFNLEVSPKNFTTNDWGDSIASSNTKDVLLINNFDSDTIALHMVKDWDCWRR